MSRQIKFRAWDKHLKKFYFDSDTLHIAGNKIFVHLDQDKRRKSYFISAADCEFSQFTGLQDKAGRDIYEGDIIAYDMESARWLIEWRDAGFYAIRAIRPDTKEIHVFSEGWFAGAAIVIGNVYENPELITHISPQP